MISMSCSIELSPGKRGSRVRNQTIMHPADHISIQHPQLVEFNISQGARQYREHIQDTLFSFVSIILADPKSHIFNSKVYLFKRILILVFKINFANLCCNFLLPEYKNLKNFSLSNNLINFYQISKLLNLLANIRNYKYCLQNLEVLSLRKI